MWTKLVCVVLLSLLLSPLALPQCQSMLCGKRGGDSCTNDFPPYCRGNGCIGQYGCLVYIGHCPTKQWTCYARVCVEFRYCPPNPNTPVSVQSNGVTLTYVGLPEGWTPPNQVMDDFNSTAWLTIHPEFNRTETYLGHTVYVHQFVMDNGDVGERWYDPLVGVVPVRFSIAGGDGFSFVAQAVAIQ